MRADPTAGRPCLRPSCDGVYRLVAVVDRERWYRCTVCSDDFGWQALDPDEPMPSERGIPEAELLDASEKKPTSLRDLIDIARRDDEDQDDEDQDDELGP